MGSDTFNLSDAEQAFFATGELPDELANALGGHTNPDEPPSEPDPKIEAVPAPVAQVDVPPAPQADALELMRRSLQEEQRLRADLEARLNAQIEAAKPREVAPDPDTDPLGSMMHQLNNVNKTVQELQTRLMEQQQQATQQQQIAEFRTSMNSLRDEYVKTNPNFQAAYEHLRNARTEDLKSIGLPSDQIQQALMRDEIILAQNAIQQGKNPAELIYNMATRHGYTPTAAAAKPTTPTTTKLDTIQRGQSQSKTVASTPASNESISIETLKNASDDDLNKLVLDDKAWNKISGNSSLNDLFH